MTGYSQIYEKIHQMIKNDYPEGLTHLSFDQINYLWCVYYEKLFNLFIKDELYNTAKFMLEDYLNNYKNVGEIHERMKKTWEKAQRL